MSAMASRLGIRVMELAVVLACGFAEAGIPPLAHSRGLQQSPLVNLIENALVHDRMPSYKTSHPSSDTTLLEIRNPSCFGKGAALLGSFCVPPTTPEQDADPENKLPRITFSVKRYADGSPITLFLFDDEKNSWPAFWEMSMRNRSCEEMAAKATVLEGQEGLLQSYKNIMGKFPHNWYIVAVDCKSNQCPAVHEANLTFFHPLSDGSADACSGLPQPALALKEALVEGWSALRVDNLLHVAGLSPFGVTVLYAQFAAMLLCAAVFLLWGARADSSRRMLHWLCLFVAVMSAMCYLALATGNGIIVLRHLGADAGGGGGAWQVSESLVANPGSAEHPNPLYDAAYASARTYPVLVARHAVQLPITSLLLWALFLVSGVGPSARAFMLFFNAAAAGCWLAGAVVTAPSRWGFWAFGLVFSAAVLAPMVGVLPTAAARRGRAVRRLYGRLMCVQLLAGALYPWAWVLIDGAHALPSDLAVLGYVAFDFVSQCVFGVLLLSRAPPAAGWAAGMEDAAGDPAAMERLRDGDELAGGGGGGGGGGKGRFNGGGAAMGGGAGLGQIDEL